MIATVLGTGSLTDLAATLAAAGLPISDLAEPGRRFFRFEDGAGLVGYGGIEGTGPDRLLRSPVVKPDRRGSGSGTAIERAAAGDGATSLYLLTATAEPFFRRQGYETADRADAPAVIVAAAKFRSLCPASAAFLSKRIA